MPECNGLVAAAAATAATAHLFPGAEDRKIERGCFLIPREGCWPASPVCLPSATTALCLSLCKRSFLDRLQWFLSYPL